MKIAKEGPLLLGLDKKEKLILEALTGAKPMRPVDLAVKTEVKRTTINFLLKKLADRGLVKRVMVGGHYEWLTNKELKKKVDNLYQYFNLSGEITIHRDADIGVEIFKGKKEIMAAYERVLEAGYNNRVFAIQGNKSTAASWALGKSYLNNIQKKFKEHKIILEGIIGESALFSLRNLDIDFLKTYENRLVVGYIVSDTVVDFDMDILIFKKMIVMINFEKQLVLVVKNQSIYEAIFNMFEAMKLAGRKIDLNDYVKNLIKEKQ
ncbi:MAG: helix-turn-helix domain-containing protein [bacterium]